MRAESINLNILINCDNIFYIHRIHWNACYTLNFKAVHTVQTGAEY